MTPISLTNKIGFPAVASISNSLTTTASTFIFNRHQPAVQNFEGGVFVKISDTPTAPTTAVPIQFSTQGVSNSAVPVYNAQGTALTTATFPGDGIYIGFVDNDKVYLLNT